MELALILALSTWGMLPFKERPDELQFPFYDAYSDHTVLLSFILKLDRFKMQIRRGPSS
jgi:hypothetical protein